MSTFHPVRTSDLVPTPRDGWRWVLLRDVARLESGHTPSRREPSYWEGGDVPWLSLKDIRGLSGRYVRETQDKPTAKGIDNSSARILPRGTVAFCRTASVGKVVILGREMATSQDFANWVCGPELLPEYLYEALRASGSEFSREKQGTTHKTIYMPVLERFRVLVPPLAEQRRIADILDKADAIRRKRKEAIALTDELLRSTFLEMFGDPVTNPKGWPVKPLGELFSAIDSGWSPVCQARPANDSEWGVLKLGAVTFGRYNAYENKALVAELAPLPELEVRVGDVLFSRKNTYEHVAACVFVASTRPKLMLPDLIFRLVLSSSSGLRPETLWALLSNERMRKKVQGLAGGTAGSMPNISKERLKTVNLPVPPMAQQERFAEAMRRCESTRIALEAAARASEVLFESLVARGFSGGLENLR